MARIPKLDSAGRFLAADVNAQIDARTKATMRADLPALAKELKIGGVDGSVPIFPTLAEAEAWEAANPGKKALTLEPSTPDTTAPTWNATLAVGTPTDKQVVVTASALATDDRAVAGYEVTYNGSTWSAITPTGKNFTLSGSAGQAYTGTKLRAKDAAGNASPALSVPSYTMAATPPHPYITAAQGMGLQHIYALDGTASSTTNRGTASTPALYLNSPTYGTGIAGFTQSITGGSVQLNNYLPAGIPAYTIGAVVKTRPDISTFKHVIGDWNSKNAVKAASVVPWDVAGPTTASAAIGTAKAAPDTVYHVVLTWDGTALALYVDGALVGTRADAGPVATSAALQFGAGNLSNAAVSGAIVDTTKALTAAQVKQLSDAVAR